MLLWRGKKWAITTLNHCMLREPGQLQEFAFGLSYLVMGTAACEQQQVSACRMGRVEGSIRA
jgi:hypothetical protein